jgi:hypothetical protein
MRTYKNDHLAAMVDAMLAGSDRDESGATSGSPFPDGLKFGPDDDV